MYIWYICFIKSASFKMSLATAELILLNDNVRNIQNEDMPVSMCATAL